MKTPRARIALLVASLAASVCAAVTPAGALGGRHRAVSAVGLLEIDGHPARVDVVVDLPPGADEEKTTRKALQALGARPSSDIDAEFGLSRRWPQFFDTDPGNDFVRQFYNPSGQPPTGGDYQVAFLAGQTPWTDVPTSTFAFEFGGTTSRCPSAFSLCGETSRLDGFNDVGWFPLPGSTLGATFTLFPLADPQVILEADVVINSNFEWFVDPDAATPTSFDAQHVILHENGHVAGVEHSADPQAVMARFLAPGELGPRVLTQDDIAAISTLYPLDPVESNGGDLDVTFGGDGKVTTDIGGVASSPNEVHALALPDGKILAAGVMVDPTTRLGDFALARYHADGSLDTGFGSGGRVTSDLGGDDQLNGVALQTDGKIVAAGYAINPDDGLADFAVARYLPNGSLDTSFGEAGTVTTNLVGDDAAFAIVVQPDGQIVAAGTAGSDLAGPFDFALVRYNADGSLDTSFGTAGTVTTDFGGDFEQAFAAALQSDGSIVAAGFTTAGGSFSDFALARYLPDGTLDTTFDLDGTVTTDFTGNNDQANALVIQPDGAIVAAGLSRGAAGGLNFALARYLPDGSLDPAFDNDGKVTTDFAGGTDIVQGLALDLDGKLVAAGRAFMAGNTDFGLARYDTDGTLDPSFDTDGRVTTDFAGGTDIAFAVAVQPDNKLVAGGRATNTGGTDFALARYDTSGALDPSFDTDGKVTTDFEVALATDDRANAVAIQPDGKVVAAGSAANAGGERFVVVRYNPDGSLDPTFDTDGKVTTDFGGGAARAFGVVVQPDGKIVAGGESAGDFALARYLPDGTLDQSFGVGGMVTTDFASPGDVASAIVLQPNGRIVLAGSTFSDGPGLVDFALARYLPDGNLDPSFGVGGMVTTDFAGSIDEAFAIALQPNGRLVVAGSAFSDGLGFIDFALARYLADGTLDPAFGSSGTVTADLAGSGPSVDVARAVTLQPNGRIVAAGLSASLGADADFAVARFRPDGSLDTTFSTDGVVIQDFGTGEFASGVAVQPDGRILAGGTNGSDFILSRYQPDGARDTGFGMAGQVQTDFDRGLDQALAIAIQPDPKIKAGRGDRAETKVVVAGFTNPAGFGVPADIALARYRLNN